MTSTKKKSEKIEPDQSDNLGQEIAELETAIETMMAYVGYLSKEIIAEEKQSNPNLAKIAALEEQMDAVYKERKTLSPDDKHLIARAIYVYAPIMKAIYLSRANARELHSS